MGSIGEWGKHQLTPEQEAVVRLEDTGARVCTINNKHSMNGGTVLVPCHEGLDCLSLVDENGGAAIFLLCPQHELVQWSQTRTAPWL